MPQPSHTSFVSAEDEVVLEDSNARIRLIFDEAAVSKGLSVTLLPTGKKVFHLIFHKVTYNR